MVGVGLDFGDGEVPCDKRGARAGTGSGAARTYALGRAHCGLWISGVDDGNVLRPFQHRNGSA
jgi:hypothetical protein